MNKTITMNIRMDEDTRRKLKDFSGQIGIPATSLVNACIKQMLRSRQATFTTDLEPTPYLEKLIKEAEADYKARRNITIIKNKTELEAFFDSL
jgi:antitoxin component of RelBE/YafQ-DinJ toxin-antitoxin module